MKRKVYIAVAAALALTCLVDLIFPDHHHVVFAWHRIRAFEAFFGFAGCFLLMFGSIGLGHYLLWKPTFSAVLAEDALKYGSSSAEVKRWLVELDDEVVVGQPILDLEARSGAFTISSPKSGKVNRLRVGPGEVVKAGDTLMEIEFSGHHDEEDADV